ncbi:MAG: hypothetical protein GY859_11540 [Desulfobacterales bacterium]|nr:hypothetical protein [Desulfobacterales bacterium]
MDDNNETPRETTGARPKPLKGWAILIGTMGMLWVFAVYIGPWAAERIPVFNEIVRTIEKHDIDAGAYFYTEIKASYEGERYLRDSLELGAPEQARFSLQFISGIVICLLLLGLGWRFLPMD